MAEVSIDDLLQAVETVSILKETLRRHESMIAALSEELDAVKTRLISLETSRRRRRDE